MSSRLRDALWLAVAALALAWVVASAVLAIRQVLGSSDLLANLLAILGLGVLGVVGFWLVAGAWLRTSWGRRFLARRPAPASSARPNGSSS